MSKPTALQLPPPRAAMRTRKVLVALTIEEHEALHGLAAKRSEPAATVARTLIVAALEALRTER